MFLSHILTAYELNKEPTPQLWKSDRVKYDRLSVFSNILSLIDKQQTTTSQQIVPCGKKSVLACIECAFAIL